MDALTGILNTIKALSQRISRLEAQSTPHWHYLQAPLTAAAWEGTTHSDTAKTLIDLSAVFAVPAGVKVVLVEVAIQDIDSTGPDDNCITLGPTNAAGVGTTVRSKGRYDNDLECHQRIVPCDTNGDIYYEVAASGVLSLTAWIRIWGYEL